MDERAAVNLRDQYFDTRGRSLADVALRVIWPRCGDSYTNVNRRTQRIKHGVNKFRSCQHLVLKDS